MLPLSFRSDYFAKKLKMELKTELVVDLNYFKYVVSELVHFSSFRGHRMVEKLKAFEVLISHQQYSRRQKKKRYYTWGIGIWYGNIPSR